MRAAAIRVDRPAERDPRRRRDAVERATSPAPRRSACPAPPARRSGGRPPAPSSPAARSAAPRRWSGSSQRTNTCSHSGRTESRCAVRPRGAARSDMLAGQRLARGRGDLAPARARPACARPAKLTTLLWRRAAAQPGRVGARRALDEHLERAADEALGALARAALDDLDEPLHALDLHLVRDELVGELGRLGPAPRREDERERAVVADLLDDLERLARSPPRSRPGSRR